MTERTPFVISTEKGCKPAEWRNLARLRIGRQTFFSPCSALLYRSRQDPSTDARDDRKGERLLRLLLCHPELVVARLCCQHFADGKMLDLQGGSSSSQKSRCAAIFGSPVL